MVSFDPFAISFSDNIKLLSWLTSSWNDCLTKWLLTHCGLSSIHLMKRNSQICAKVDPIKHQCSLVPVCVLQYGRSDSYRVATTQDKDEKESPKKKAAKDMDDLKKEVPLVCTASTSLPTSRYLTSHILWPHFQMCKECTLEQLNIDWTLFGTNNKRLQWVM